MTDKNEKLEGLINAGKQTFRTSAGSFGPQDRVQLPPAEAAKLKKYPGVISASEYKEPTDATTALKARVKELEGQNADLQKQVDKLSKDLEKASKKG